jgi:photosystem II stability/assembly factor-like uncharacterized protein
MTDVRQSQPYTVTVILSDSSSGDPKTGVTASDVSFYYRKDGGSVISKVIDGSNFREVDASNMPGLYEFDLTSFDLDTVGEFVAVIPSNGNIGLAQANISLTVVSDEPPNPDNEYIGEIQQGSSSSLLIHLESNDGEMVRGVEPSSLTFRLVKDDTSVTPSYNSTWQELDRSGYPGTYLVELSGSETDTVGDLHVSVDPSSPDQFSAVESDLNVGTSDDLNALAFEPGDPEARGVAVTQTGEILTTDDRGDNWSSASYSPSPGPLLDVDTGQGGTNVFAGDDGSAPYIAYWNGNSFNTVTSSQGSGISRAIALPETSNDLTASIPAFALTLNTDLYIESFLEGAGSTTLAYSAASSERLYDLAMPEQQIVVSVGEDSGTGEAIVVRTTDQGSSWSTLSLGTPGGVSFRAVDFLSGTSIGWGVGNEGLLMRTEDAGATWTRQDGGSYPNLFFNDVYAASNKTAYAVGLDVSVPEPVVFQTTDGGSNWSRVSALESLLSNEINGVDGVYAEGRVWTSGVGGESARSHYTPGYLQFRGVRYRGEVVERIESDTYNEVVSNGSTVSNISSTVNTIDTKVDDLDADIISVQQDVTDIQNRTQTIKGDVRDVQGSGFVSADHSLKDLSDRFNNRIPQKAALQKHLGEGSGQILAPSDVGIWDVLGDGTRTIPGLGQDLDRVLGLSQENYRITDQTYDVNDNLTEATVKLYDTKSDTINDQNPTDTYQLEATYDSDGRLQDYSMYLD